MNNRFVLDCTLRDGGYVNNWDFDEITAHSIIDNIYNSGIRHIELGLLGLKDGSKFSTKFSNFSEIDKLLYDKKVDCTYYVMLNISEINEFDFPICSTKTVDGIRVAFFQNEWESAIANVQNLINKGYKVFLQAMATHMYSKEELTTLVHAVNKVSPAGLYIVDSFGTFFNSDLIEIANMVDEILNNNIILGFHAHNNYQMAFSNAISFFNIRSNRDLITDSSIYGMGRGAGNVPTELLINYLNVNGDGKYKVEYITECFEQNILPIYTKKYWGYTYEHFLSAVNKVNPVYTWYIGLQANYKIIDYDKIFKFIPDSVKHFLSKQDIDEIMRKFNDNEK